MTTIESTFSSQTQLERRVVPPSSDGESNEVTKDPYDAQVEAFFEQDKADFHGLLDLRLRGELVAQLFKEHPEEVARGSVNLTEMQAVLRTHIAQAMDSNIQQASFIDNVAIPKARTQFEAPVDPKPGDVLYQNKDVPRLEAREDSYLQMVSYLTQFEPESADAYLELTEEHIRRLLPEARQEAIEILKQKVDEREAQKREAELEIERLEHTIDVLLVERDAAREEVTDRDMQILDGELEAHLSEVDELTQAAKRLAQ